MIMTMEQLKAILQITHFDFHVRDSYFVIWADRGDEDKLQKLHSLLSKDFKAILWGSLDGSKHTIWIPIHISI